MNINERWEKGIPHHPESVKLYKFIEKLDYEECGDSFGFESGGDGDNGETLMYLMDEYFERLKHHVPLPGCPGPMLCRCSENQ
jgi:hypothetical protein